MDIIESIRIMVRPLTLSFRLAANMTAGHIILCLVSTFSNTPNNNIIHVTLCSRFLRIAVKVVSQLTVQISYNVMLIEPGLFHA